MILNSNTKFYLETRDRVAAFSFLEGREVVLSGDAREEGAHHAGEGGPPLSEHLGLGDLSEGPVPGLLADVSGDQQLNVLRLVFDKLFVLLTVESSS